jgi:hypothetical protein
MGDRREIRTPSRGLQEVAVIGNGAGRCSAVKCCSYSSQDCVEPNEVVHLEPDHVAIDEKENLAGKAAGQLKSRPPTLVSWH